MLRGFFSIDEYGTLTVDRNAGGGLAIGRDVRILRKKMKILHAYLSLQILRTIFRNSAQICALFRSDFSTLKLSLALLYDPVFFAFFGYIR